MHLAAALFDPAVAPPSEFAVYNAFHGEREVWMSLSPAPSTIRAERVRT